MTKTPPPEYNIGIIGCGKMGQDLFEFMTGFPFRVILICKTETSIEQIEKAFIKKQKRALKYNLIDKETFDFRQENTVITTDLQYLKTCELVIESITEDIQKKMNLFKQLEQILTPECVLTSNTSSITLDHLFSDLQFKGRCVGLHFFYPVAIKDIAEVNMAKNTSEKTVSLVNDFLRKIGKFYIVLSQRDHFIVNRIFLKMQAGCCQLIQNGTLSVNEIDALVKAHLFPVGVFEFFDHVGNDVMLQSVKNYVHFEADPEFYQALIETLKQKVNQGKLGIKSNSGFYDYPVTIGQKPQEILNSTELVKKITVWYLDGVYDVLNSGICSKEELEHITREYMMVEKSPFDLAKEIGYSPK